MGFGLSRFATILLAVLTPAGAVGRAEVVERVMAVVDGAIILQSDVAAARRFGLVSDSDAAAGNTLVLERLIERRLVLTEVNRYAPPEPGAAEVDRKVAELRGRFASAQSLDAALAETGLTLDQLTRRLRDDLRIEAYLRQRFAAAMLPAEAEILQYYRDHQEMFTRGGIVRPFGEVHDEARAALVEERRSSTIREWIAALRRRANVSVPGIVPLK